MDEDGINGLTIVWSNMPYAASNASGRAIGSTNITLNLTNDPDAKMVDAGVASLGGTATNLPWNTWTEMP